MAQVGRREAELIYRIYRRNRNKMTSNEIINILKTGLDENEIQNLYVNEIVREPGAKGFIRINNMWFIYGNQDERGNISFNGPPFIHTEFLNA